MLDALKACNGNKAPGLDGITVVFTKSAWDTIKRDVVALMSDFYDHGAFEKSLDATFLAMVPKKGWAIGLKDYRPVSLVRCIY